MGLNEADLHALARLLSGFGVWLSVAEHGAPAQPMAGTPDAAAQPPSASTVVAAKTRVQRFFFMFIPLWVDCCRRAWIGRCSPCA